MEPAPPPIYAPSFSSAWGTSLGQDRSQEGGAPAPAVPPVRRPDRCIVHLAVIEWCVCDRESRAMPSEITVGPRPRWQQELAQPGRTVPRCLNLCMRRLDDAGR